jgi:hypothetical protein
MDKFYTYVVIVAFVILVLALIGLGVILQNQDKGEVFPPIQSKCPDGWMTTASGCYIDSSKNIGTFIKTNLTAADQKYLLSSNGAGAIKTAVGASYELVFKPEALPCDKRKWANMHGILWDGISNYNQC